MAIKNSDLKILWAKSGNRCAMCRESLAPDDGESKIFILGEQAHIIGKTPTAARGEEEISDELRNNHDNLMLLCPNCHTKIDKNSAKYSVEKLRSIKKEHENWVEQRLSYKDKDKKDDIEFIQTYLNNSLFTVTPALIKELPYYFYTGFIYFVPQCWRDLEIDMSQIKNLRDREINNLFIKFIEESEKLVDLMSYKYQTLETHSIVNDRIESQYGLRTYIINQSEIDLISKIIEKKDIILELYYKIIDYLREYYPEIKLIRNRLDNLYYKGIL